MKFLTPAAFGFLTLAIPILLLYMLKLRRKPVQVSSTLLWEQLLRDRQANAPWQKLRRNLLLFLQLLILAALSLALARPAVQTPVVASGSLIVLLDASASMNAVDVTPSRFEAARRAVQDLIARLPPASRLTLILVGRTPQVLAAAETDPARLREALASAQVSQGGADWQAALALAAGVAQGSRDATTLILSDGGLPESGLPSLPGQVRYLPIGAQDDNLAVTALALRASASGLELFAEVSNCSRTAREAVLSFYLGEALLTARRLSLPPVSGDMQCSARSLTLDDLPDRPGVYQARLSAVDGKDRLDALSLDDSAFAVYQAASARRVLLVSPGNLFLEQALAAMPGIQPFRALPGPSGAPQMPAETFDLYILDGLLPEPLPAGNLLFVNPASNPLFQVGDPFDDMSGLQVHEHPLTRFVDWSNVHVMQARSVQLPAWAETLVGTQAGPLVFAGETEGRRIAALTFDLRESDLPLQVAYPILFANLLDYLVPPNALRQGFDMLDPTAQGDTFDASRSLQPGESLSILPPPGVQQVVVVSPAGKAYAFTPLASAITFTETGELGYYAVNFIGQDSQTYQTFAVNLFDPLESDIRPRATIQVGSAEIVPAQAEQMGQREIWPWLAGVALFVLLAEWQAYHRRTPSSAPPPKIRFMDFW